MFDLVIEGGDVVTPTGVGRWDVAISGERIAAVAIPGTLRERARRVLDAVGQLVIPGGIDPHVHCGLTIGSEMGLKQATAEMTVTGGPDQVSRAALFGGTTTLIDFANWRAGQSFASVIEKSEASWAGGYTDHAQHLLIAGALPAEALAEVPEVVRAGYPTLKVFTSNVRPGNHHMANLGQVGSLMRLLARHGGVLAVHAEDDDLVMDAHERLRREGRTGVEQMPEAHSVLSEELAFRRTITLARSIEGAAVYLVHVSAKAGVDAIAEARAAGQPVYGETLHHYATFTADVYRRPDGVLFHTYPSIKYDEDRDRLWSGLRDGTLNTVATDEVCTTRAVKMTKPTLFDAVGGHVGVETRLAIVYTEGVSKRGLSLERFVATTSTNAAKILGLYPRKGVVAPGSDADLVIFDPRVRRVLRSAELHGSDYSAWEGWEVHGWPSVVLLRGSVAVDHGTLLARSGDGRAVLRKVLPAIQAGPAVS